MCQLNPTSPNKNQSIGAPPPQTAVQIMSQLNIGDFDFSFDALYDDPECRDHFFEFCRKEHADESIAFLGDVERLKYMRSTLNQVR